MFITKLQTKIQNEKKNVIIQNNILSRSLCFTFSGLGENVIKKVLLTVKISCCSFDCIHRNTEKSRRTHINTAGYKEMKKNL